MVLMDQSLAQLQRAQRLHQVSHLHQVPHVLVHTRIPISAIASSA